MYLHLHVFVTEIKNLDEFFESCAESGSAGAGLPTVCPQNVRLRTVPHELGRSRESIAVQPTCFFCGLSSRGHTPR
jgi:hypothetical protein